MAVSVTKEQMKAWLSRLNRAEEDKVRITHEHYAVVREMKAAGLNVVLEVKFSILVKTENEEYTELACLLGTIDRENYLRNLPAINTKPV
ncbi:MAG TPA: hypothetical protein VMT99_00475 [Candidatus Paceibacterota bacterium]|nr:hypothetical protein [Candidatus Paceibacterota bacterium]